MKAQHAATADELDYIVDRAHRPTNRNRARTAAKVKRRSSRYDRRTNRTTMRGGDYN